MPSPTPDKPLTAAVVGAGLSGLACARRLVDRGWSIRVFDKGRGVGGRMSTRRTEDRSFDHGAQYFTVRDVDFRRLVESWREDGLVAPWEGEIAVLEDGVARSNENPTERLVGVPAMNAICKHLASDLDVTLATRVEAPEFENGRWRLVSDRKAELGVYDSLVVSAPAPQTAALLRGPAPDMAARAARVGMAPCWAVMASFTGSLDLGFDAAFVHGSPLCWIARNDSKPGRAKGEAWVLHGSPDWSEKHVEIDPQEAAGRLLDAFRRAVDGWSRDPSEVTAHRWRFALPTEPLPERYLFDTRRRLGACGDWCGGPRVEGAFLSGDALAVRLLGESLAVDV